MIKTLFTRNGIPFFILGGQVHNSSAYSLAEMDTAWKALDALKANTAEVPVDWGQIEPARRIRAGAALSSSAKVVSTS